MKNIYAIILFIISSFCYGQINYSLEFDGIDDRLDLGYLDAFEATGDVTIETWVKPYSTPNESEFDIFVLGGNGHLFLKYNNDSSFKFTIVLTDNNVLQDGYEIYSEAIYPPNHWYHVAAVYNNITNMGYLYINGEEVGSIGTPNKNFYAPNSSNSNIGSYYQPFYGSYFHGAISSVHITQDVKYSSNFCPESNLQPTTNTIGLWLMNEGSGTIVNDDVNSYDGILNGPVWISDVPTNNFPDYIPLDGLDGWWSFSGNADDTSGNANDGAVNGSILTTDRFGCPNRAYSFNGVDNNIELQEPYFGGSDNVTEFTFSYWVYLNSLPLSGDTYEVLHFNSFWRQKHTGIGENGEIHFGGANPNPNDYFGLISSNNVVIPNQWYNIIITYENSILKLYVDGVLMSTESITQATLDFSKVISGDSNGKNLIGSRTDVNNGETEFFNGKIDDIGTWNRALTNCEIQDIASSELNPIDNTLSATINSIVANQDGALYQWLDCNNGNTPIEGEVNQEFLPVESGTYSVEINYNGCIINSECFVFESLNIKEESLDNFKIYPNPTRGVLNIKSKNIIHKIRVYNSLGKKILDISSNAFTETIDISGFNSGIYFVEVSTEKKVSTNKIFRE
jgi:hypothetical protein